MNVAADLDRCFLRLRDAVKSEHPRRECVAELREQFEQLKTVRLSEIGAWRDELTRRMNEVPADDPDIPLIVFLFVEALIDLVDGDLEKAYVKRELSIREVDPDPSYWFSRWDGGKADERNEQLRTHQYRKDGNYLKLTMPQPSATDLNYCNAEIYNNPYTKIKPKNVIINPFPVDSLSTPHEVKNFLIDTLLNEPYVPSQGVMFQAKIQASGLRNGSRGWGFGNTSVSIGDMRLAWFVQYDGKGEGLHPLVPESGFYVQTMNGPAFDVSLKPQISSVRIGDLDDKMHEYRIELTSDEVRYWVDGKLVHAVDDVACIPNAPMAFHCWVDNALFGISPRHEITHIVQPWIEPRVNLVEYFSVATLPQKALLHR